MADAIDGTLGFGTVAGSSASPVDILTLTKASGKDRNFVVLTNTDVTNWLFAKDSTDPGCYKIALPGQSLTIAHGPQSANNVTKIRGWGATPSNAGNASVLVVVSGDKFA